MKACEIRVAEIVILICNQFIIKLWHNIIKKLLKCAFQYRRTHLYAIEMSPASATIHKTPIKHEIYDNALAHIQTQIDMLKDVLFYNKSIRERDERIVLLEKESNCLRIEINNQQFIAKMLISNENGKTQ